MSKNLFILFVFFLLYTPSDARLQIDDRNYVSYYNRLNDLSTKEQNELINWVNTYCNEEHKTWNQLLNDCKLECNVPRTQKISKKIFGLPGFVSIDYGGSVYGESSKIDLEALLFILAFLAILFTIYYVYYSRFTHQGKIIFFASLAVVGMNAIFYEFMTTISIYLIIGGFILVMLFLKYQLDLDSFNFNKVFILPVFLGLSLLPLAVFPKMAGSLLQAENFSITRLNVSKFLFSMSAESAKKKTLLQHVVKSGNLEAVKYMVEVEKENPNAIPLAIVLQHKCYNIANYLIQYTPEFQKNYFDYTPLSVAAIAHNSELLNRLIDNQHYFDDATIFYALKESIIYNDLEAMKIILKRLKVKDYYYSERSINLLAVAVDEENQKAFDFLLKYFNLDTIPFCANDKINSCEKIAEEATFIENIEIIKLLIANGYKVTCSNLSSSIFYN